MRREIISISEQGNVYLPSNGNVWMAEYEIADLFGCYTSKVNGNIRSILKSDVLNKEQACRTYQYENGSLVEEYSLEMIIALSFRIQTKNAEVFRQWLTRKLTKAEIPEMLIMAIQNPMLN